jgi:hypothetical protein
MERPLAGLASTSVFHLDIMGISWTGPVFMFCAPGLVFGGIEDFGSLYRVLRSRTRFRRYRGRWVPF